MSVVGRAAAKVDDLRYRAYRALMPAGGAPDPKVVSIEVTRICNLRCPYCWLWGTKGSVKQELAEKNPLVTNILKGDEIRKLLDELAPAHPYIHIAGGEPFLREDTIDLMEYASSIGLRVGTISNGTLWDQELVDRLVRIPNLNSVAFSLDGPPEIHDSFRGKGNYARTIAFAKAILAARREKGHPWVTTNSTMTPGLQSHIAEMLSGFADVGFDNTKLQHLWFTTKEQAEAQAKRMLDDFDVDDHGADFHLIEQMPGAEYGRSLIREVHMAQGIVAPYPVQMRPNLTEDEAALYYSDINWTVPVPCRRPWTEVVVHASGDVVFCPDRWASGHPAGNLRYESFWGIWRSRAATEFRESIAGGEMPACARCCGKNITYGVRQ